MKPEAKQQYLDMIPRVFVRALRDPHGNEEFELSEGEATDLLIRREQASLNPSPSHADLIRRLEARATLYAEIASEHGGYKAALYREVEIEFRTAAAALRASEASLSRVEGERDALGEALHRAHAAASDRALSLDREADETSSAIKKMQGATAAVIANDILAIANGLSRANDTQTDEQGEINAD